MIAIDTPDVFFGDGLLDQPATLADDTAIRVILEESPDPSQGGSSLSQQPGRHATIYARASEWPTPAYADTVTTEGQTWVVKQVRRDGATWALTCTLDGSARRRAS
jgi:hypothetical protein